MRLLMAGLLALVPAFAQTALVRISNISRPGQEFQIGDRFQILITAGPDQTISVRTTMHGRTDWGPTIGSTDDSGRWSIEGQFEKSDFGDWREVWTVGGKLASPAIQFSVGAPCLAGGPANLPGAGWGMRPQI